MTESERANMIIDYYVHKGPSFFRHPVSQVEITLVLEAYYRGHLDAHADAMKRIVEEPAE